MKPTSKIVNRTIFRDTRGLKTKQTFVYEVNSRRCNYNYSVEYAPSASEEHFARDSRVLEQMADEQADKMDEYDNAYGVVVSAAGLTAVVADCAVHVAGPNCCHLLLRFTVPEKQMLAGKDFEAGMPRQLPTLQQVTEYIRAYLADLAND